MATQASCRAKDWNEKQQEQERLLQRAAGCPGSHGRCCERLGHRVARGDQGQRLGLAGREVAANRSHRLKAQTRGTNRLNSENSGFDSLCDVGQRRPLHPNLLSVMSKSEMTWKAREEQTCA